MRDYFGVHPGFADPTSNELRVLSAEIDYQNRVMGYIRHAPSLPVVRCQA